jgi:hypothetical protein
VKPVKSLSQQESPHEGQWQASLGDERVVEIAEGDPFFCTEVVPKLLDLELAICVVEIRGIIRSSPSFLVGVGGLLKRLVDEKLGPLLHRPALSMQLDAGDISAVAQERFLKLC